MRTLAQVRAIRATLPGTFVRFRDEWFALPLLAPPNSTVTDPGPVRTPRQPFTRSLHSPWGRPHADEPPEVDRRAVQRAIGPRCRVVGAMAVLAFSQRHER